VGGLHGTGIRPELRLRGAATGTEDAYHRPLGLPQTHHLANIQPRKLLVRTATDNQFIATGSKVTTLNKLNIVAHRKGTLLYAAQGHIGTVASGALGNIHNHIEFGRCDRLSVALEDPR